MSVPPKRAPALVSVVEVRRRLKERGVRVEGGFPHLLAEKLESHFDELVEEGVANLEMEKTIRVSQGLKRGNPALGRRHLKVDLGDEYGEACAPGVA